MGGFKLTGPTHVIEYIYSSDMRCLCRGLHIDITAEQEAAFMNVPGHRISVPDFHRLLNNEYVHVHTYVGKARDPSRQIMYFSVKPKGAV